MKVLVTGANGFIGRLLCEVLIERGDRVLALSRSACSQLPEVECISADLTGDVKGLLDIFPGVEVIYHCAGELTDPGKMYSLHVEGTRNLLGVVQQYLKSTDASIHWVQLSSVGAYGPGEGAADAYRLVNESVQPAPVGAYEVTKTISDELVVSADSLEGRFSYSVLRPSNVIGRSMKNRSFFQFCSMIRRRLFFYLGQGSALATYVHVNDVVRALVSCGTLSAARQQCYILSNDCTQKALVESIARFYRVSRPVLRLPAAPFYFLVEAFPSKRSPLSSARLDALIRNTNYSSDKIRRELGFEFLCSIPDSVPELLGESLEKTDLK